MKIIKINANFPPKRCGIADYTRILCENLVNLKKDISFYIITSANPKVIESSYSYERIKILPVISDWSFKNLHEIRKIIREISPDIVHIEFNRGLYSRNIAMNFLPYLLKKENPRYRIITTFHSLPGPLKNKDPLFWLTSLSILVNCEKIIVTNDMDYNSFICKLPFVRKKCILIPVGSNIPKVENRKNMVRKKLNIAEDGLILSFFGFIREDKCLEELFYAFGELLSARRNLKLLIIGGILSEEIFLYLQKLSHKLNINDMVTWIDYQSGERISELLQASDIVVLPYRNGISTNSGAFAACVLNKLPIVTTKAKFMPEVIKDNYNLMLVKPRSIKALTDALYKITVDAGLRKRLSENLEGLNDYLSWKRVSQEILKLYNQKC